MNEPGVFVHADVPAEQVFMPSKHSLMSEHATPLPVKPVLHAQVNDPAVSVHVDVPAAQLCVRNVHSVLLVHMPPLLV